jgi:hypothetical protein
LHLPGVLACPGTLFPAETAILWKLSDRTSASWRIRHTSIRRNAAELLAELESLSAGLRPSRTLRLVSKTCILTRFCRGHECAVRIWQAFMKMRHQLRSAVSSLSLSMMSVLAIKYLNCQTVAGRRNSPPAFSEKGEFYSAGFRSVRMLAHV